MIILTNYGVRVGELEVLPDLFAEEPLFVFPVELVLL
jgi:hypothetical protein